MSAAIKLHPRVADAIVVGIPDERFGQRVAAVVSTRDGGDIQLAEIRAHLEPLLAGYKAPRHLVVVGELQYTPQAKPDLRWAATIASPPLEPVEAAERS